MALKIQEPTNAKLRIQEPANAKLRLSKIQQYPAVLGEPWGGGYFVGYISHTANGIPTHALIAAPVATQYLMAFSTQSQIFGNNSRSTFDGASNSSGWLLSYGSSIVTSVAYCDGLIVNGFQDWYLPAIFELDIAYFNLKPGTGQNFTGTFDGLSTFQGGPNPYSVPRRTVGWTSSFPARTNVSIFLGSESFSLGEHWSSTYYGNVTVGHQSFVTGQRRTDYGKTNSRFIRAFRRIAL